MHFAGLKTGTFVTLGTRVGFLSGCVIVTGRVHFPHLQKRTREKRKSVRFPRLEKRTREGRNSKMTESPETCNFPVNWARDGARSSNDQSTSCSVVCGIVRPSFHSLVHPLLLPGVVCLHGGRKGRSCNDLPHQRSVEQKGVEDLHPGIESGSSNHSELSETAQLPSRYCMLLGARHKGPRTLPL